MRINEILNEAGEPENPSRRGFLRALGAAGMAAAMPGTAARALSTPAAAAEVPAAATAAAAESSLVSRLWQVAANYWLDQMMDNDDRGYKFRDEDDDWDESIRGPNKTGLMPWGEYYTVFTTPGGHTVFWTGSPDGQEGIFAYEKDGEVRYIALTWDTTAADYGEVASATSEYDSDLYYAFSNQFGGDLQEEGLGELFDFIINDAPGVEKSGHYHDAPVWHQYPDKQPAADKTTAADTAPADIARLAGLAKRGYDAAMSAGEPKADEPKAAEPKAAEPKALPAPEKPDIDLTPDLKQKQAEPAKKRDNK